MDISIYLSTYLSIDLWIDLSIYLSIYLSILYMENDYSNVDYNKARKCNKKYHLPPSFCKQCLDMSTQISHTSFSSLILHSKSQGNLFSQNGV